MTRGELRHDARLLARILDFEDGPLALLSAEGKILAANSHYQRRFGNGTDLLGRHCYEVAHGSTTPCWRRGERCPLRLCSAEGRPHRCAHTHQTSDGEQDHDVKLTLVADDAAEPMFFASISQATPQRDGSHRVDMVGAAPAFLRSMDLIERVAPTDLNVLLLGESGTGKEVAAFTIHRGSRRREGPFVALDCSGLPETLFESELFGHEKGAFTGAVGRKEGLVEVAAGGTLFLDEVGDIPLPLQVKLLRLIERGTFRRVGSVDVRKSDFRLVCATNRDLGAMVAAESFRSDLYYRISTFPITIPPLRERREDIELIADALLSDLVCPTGMCRVAPETMSTLVDLPLPGNVRELRNILQRACLLSEDGLLRPEHLPPDLTASRSPAASSPPRGEIVSLREAESRYLAWAAQRFDGDRRTLARKLGLSERTLYRKLEMMRLARSVSASDEMA